MKKKKQIFLILLLIVSITLCSWSIYKHVLTDNKISSNDTKESTTTIDSTNSSQEDKANKTSSSELENNASYVTHVVEENETIDTISKNYSDNCPTNILSKSIMSINKITNKNDIKVGMELKIPEKYINDGFKYTVKKGDSLYTLANKYMNEQEISSAIQTIQQDNFLSSENIKVGTELFISSTKVQEVNAEAVDDTSSIETLNANSLKKDGQISYIVKKDETLASIAKRYEETCPQKVAENIILKFNGLEKASDIKEGMSLKLPDKYISKGDIYDVKSGDSLYSIAKDYMNNIDLTEFIKIISDDNSIKNSSITVGQQLFIASIE